MMQAINIVAFDDKWAADFKRLNKTWLETYFEVEPIDEEMLSHPRTYYLDKGGYIFLALVDDEVAGCYALIKTGEAVYELSKMAVDPAHHGKQIGNLLVQHAIATAREKGATTLQLYSHTKLHPAIHLYKKYGFTEIPIGNSQYKRTDIKMEIKLA